MINMQLIEIRKILKSKSDLKTKRNIQKFVPNIKKQYGVKISGQGFAKQKVEKLLKKVENDKEDYVRKAEVWLKSELK